MYQSTIRKHLLLPQQNGVGRTERTSLRQKKRKEVPLSGTELFVELKSSFKQTLPFRVFIGNKSIVPINRYLI